MNRRGFISSILPSMAALPAVAIQPKRQLKPPVTEREYCGECYRPLYCDSYPLAKHDRDYKAAGERTARCCMEICPQFNIPIKIFSDKTDELGRPCTPKNPSCPK